MKCDISNLSFPNVSAIYLGASSYLTPMVLTSKVDNIRRTNPNNHLLVFRATPNLTGNLVGLGINNVTDFQRIPMPASRIAI